MGKNFNSCLLELRPILCLLIEYFSGVCVVHLLLVDLMESYFQAWIQLVYFGGWIKQTIGKWLASGFNSQPATSEPLKPLVEKCPIRVNVWWGMGIVLWNRGLNAASISRLSRDNTKYSLTKHVEHDSEFLFSWHVPMFTVCGSGA